MSKSMAIEGVMKLFLMIAVIIVGMSFLMKAFGIDIFEWLQEKFGKLNEPPDFGKILYIKMDPHDSDNEVFWFYLLPENKKVQFAEKNMFYVSYFIPRELPLTNCIIYSLDQDDDFPAFNPDRGFFYYVKPLALLQDGTCDSIKSCLIDKFFISRGGCDGIRVSCGISEFEKDIKTCEKDYAGDFRFVNCGCTSESARCDFSPTEIDRELFTPLYNFKGDCNPEKLKPKCNILVPGEYRIKHGLLCVNGEWQVCKEDRYEKNTNIDIIYLNFKCERKNDDIFTWEFSIVRPDNAWTEAVRGENYQWVPDTNTRIYATDQTDHKKVGEKSIVGNKHIAGDANQRVSMTLIFNTPISISDNIYFYAKSSPPTYILVRLVDTNNRAIRVNMHISENFMQLPYAVSRNEFTGAVDNFNWNSVKKIEFYDSSGSSDWIVIDGLWLS